MSRLARLTERCAPFGVPVVPEVRIVVRPWRDGAAGSFVADTTREGKPLGGAVELAGRSWERFESDDGRTRSLVHADDEVTSIVTADADFTQLEAFTAALVEE